MEEISTLREIEQPVQEEPRAKYIGTTVLEFVSQELQEAEMNRPNQPPPTPPTSISTSTRSGSGQAQIVDDSMTDHLYE